MSGIRKRTWPSGSVTWYDSAGRRHTANYGTRAGAEAARAEQLRARQRGGSGDPTAGGLTLAAWHRRWAAARNVRPLTLAREEVIWRVHIAPALGDRCLADLRRTDIGAWVAGLGASGLAPATQVLCLAVLHLILAGAVADGVLFANPGDGVTRPRVDPGERRFLSPAELDRIEAAMDPHWSLVAPFGATVGLRIGELSALTVPDLDLDAGAVGVRGTAVELAGRRSVATPKSRVGLRVVPTVTTQLATRLAAHIEHHGLGRDDWLFAGPNGAPRSPTNWRNRVWLPGRTGHPRQPATHPARLAPHRHRRLAGCRGAGRASSGVGGAFPDGPRANLRPPPRRRPPSGPRPPRRAVREELSG